MHILLTNDDGIDAPGLAALEEIAAEVAGTGGKVTIVAPDGERSGVGHCITYNATVTWEARGPNRYAVSGNPADCVLAAAYHLLKDDLPDLVLSGVNRGNNVAQNSVYSGTIGATMEASMAEIRAIALSQFMGPDSPDDVFEPARVHGAKVVRNILDLGIWAAGDYPLFYNVNFPPKPANGVKGAKIVHQGYRPTTRFKVAETDSQNTLKVIGGSQQERSGDGTDASANLDGLISVTPMSCNLTAHTVFADVKEAFPT